MKHRLTFVKAYEMNSSMNDLLMFCGSRDTKLASSVCSALGTSLSECTIIKKLCQETAISIEQSVRSRDVFIVMPISRNVNDDIVNLLHIAYACKTSSAKEVVSVLPYLPYSRQSKVRGRGCIVSKLLANLLCKSGVTHIITVDLPQKEIQGFFDIPFQNLRASSFFINYIQTCIPNYKNAVIIAKNPGAAKMAQSYAEYLRLGIAMIHGENKDSEADNIDGRTSPPPSSYSDSGYGFLPAIPPIGPKVKPPLNIVGDVKDKIAIIVDNTIDESDLFINAAEVLRKNGAQKIYLMATHGVFCGKSAEELAASPIDLIVVTNTISHEEAIEMCPKIQTIDISILLSEAIRRIHYKESMSHLFRNVTID